MRDIFNFVNIKEVCEQRGLPYRLILEVIFGKKRLEDSFVDDIRHTARISALVEYNKSTKVISKVMYTIVITESDNYGKVVADKKGIIHAKPKYRVNIEDIPYYKDIYSYLNNMVKYGHDKYAKEYEEYAAGGLEAIWDAFHEKMGRDVVKSQDKYPKYSFILHYLELPEVEELTKVKLSSYTNKKVLRNSVRVYLMYTIQEKLKSLNYIINVDNDIPHEYLDKLHEVLFDLPDYMDRLEINKNIVSLITNKIFLQLNDKKEVYTTTVNGGKTYIGDLDDLRRYDVRLYNKLKKLLEIQYNDIKEAFQIVGN